MKKEPGVNGDWVPVSREERLSEGGLASAVTLGVPFLIQLLESTAGEPDASAWLVPLLFWIYGLTFWGTSVAGNLFRGKRWQWTEEALKEQRRYVSDARLRSRQFWGHWWVRYPIGLFFIATAVVTLMSRDFVLQWISYVLLLSAFVTPFVFMAEMVLLPLGIAFVLGLIAAVTLLPVAVIVMFSFLAMVAIVVVVQNRRAKQPPVLQPADDGKGKDGAKAAEEAKDAAAAAPAAEAQADAAAAAAAPADAQGDAATGETATGDAANGEAAQAAAAPAEENRSAA